MSDVTNPVLLNATLLALPVIVGVLAFVRQRNHAFLLIVFALILPPLLAGLMSLIVPILEVQRDSIVPLMPYVALLPTTLITVALWQLATERADESA